MRKKKIDLTKVNTASDLLNAKYNEIGFESRNEFQENDQKFYISDYLKKAMKEWLI